MGDLIDAILSYPHLPRETVDMDKSMTVFRSVLVGYNLAISHISKWLSSGRCLIWACLPKASRGSD